MKLWGRAGAFIAEKKGSVSFSALPAASAALNVCTGSEWYQFPSHFFLPASARVQYVQDGFGGILPQHFSEINGTFAEPAQEFNDRNREVTTRYVNLAQCDYLVILIDANKPAQESTLRQQLLQDGGIDNTRFRQVASEKVISAEFSVSALFRAFYIPGLSTSRVKFQEYVLFEQVK
jgi:alpha-1,2-mannosyltransferase